MPLPPPQPQATLQASALVLPPSHPVVETEQQEEMMVVEKGDGRSDVVDREIGGRRKRHCSSRSGGCSEKRAKAGSGTDAIVAASGATATATAAAGAVASAAATRATATATGTTAPR